MAEDRFVIDDVVGHDLPDGTVIARNRRTGAQIPLPGEVFNAISHCDAFRTMEEHIAHLAGPGARGREGEIRHILQSVIDGGLMLLASEISARLEPGVGSIVAPAPVVSVITRECPDALARLLTSMQGHCQLEAVDRIWVVDDSRGSEAVSANQEVIRNANGELESAGLPAVQYFGTEQARALTRNLVERLPQHESGIRFLLERDRRGRFVTTGITRNFSQLLGMGHPLLVFDDDVLCSAIEPPTHSDGVEFSARQRECRFFASEDDWPGLLGEGEGCPIRRHLQVLGADLSTSLANLGQGRPESSAFEFATPGFARRLEAGAKVLVSQCGSYGDPGSGGNEWIALLPAQSRTELASLVENVESAPQERNCWLGRSRPVFEPRANMSQLTGLDDRDYLPPYFPLLRGQDKTFGAMTEFLFPGSLAADLPFALPHLPLPRRSWGECHRGFSLPFGLSHFLNDFITAEVRNCGAEDPMSRNQWLALMYDDLADSPDHRILELVADHWAQQRIDWLTRLALELGPSASATPALGHYLGKLMQQLQSSAIPDLQVAQIKGPPEGLSGDRVLAFWRDSWSGFAAGLRAWPEIRQAARELL
jgi:hypothetical protein